jgi:hypothetical protein
MAVQSAPDDHSRAKLDEAAACRCRGPAADDSSTGLRESKQQEVSRWILPWTSASVEPIEFEPSFDRLVDPLDGVPEQFGTVFEPDGLSLKFDPLFDLCDPEIGLVAECAIGKSGWSPARLSMSDSRSRLQISLLGAASIAVNDMSSPISSNVSGGRKSVIVFLQRSSSYSRSFRTFAILSNRRTSSGRGFLPSSLVRCSFRSSFTW